MVRTRQALFGNPTEWLTRLTQLNTTERGWGCPRTLLARDGDYAVPTAAIGRPNKHSVELRAVAGFPLSALPTPHVGIKLVPVTEGHAIGRPGGEVTLTRPRTASGLGRGRASLTRRGSGPSDTNRMGINPCHSLNKSGERVEAPDNRSRRPGRRSDPLEWLLSESHRPVPSECRPSGVEVRDTWRTAISLARCCADRRFWTRHLQLKRRTTRSPNLGSFRIHVPLVGCLARE